MKLLSLPAFVLSLSCATGIADALVARTIQERALTDPLAHGNYGKSGDEVWRYQQVGDGLFVGVKPEEWNDEIHRRGVPLLEAETMQPRAELLKVDDDTLSNRDLTQRCKHHIRCTAEFARVAGVTIAEATGGLVRKLTEVYGQKFLPHANQPVFANFYGVGGQNLVVTGLFTGLESSRPESCSSENSHADLVNSLFTIVGNEYTNVGAASVELTLPNGKKATLSLSVKENEEKPAEQCGAPGAPAN